MFEAYGAEDKLMASFQRFHNKFLESYTLPSLQKALDKDKEIVIGRARIGELIDQVIQKHGTPKIKDYPRSVVFLLVAKRSKRGQKSNGFFLNSIDTRTLYIGKVVSKVNDVTFDFAFQNLMRHEFQHLLLHMYSGEPSAKYNTKDIGKTHYYYNEGEMQSFCTNIAYEALDDLKTFYNFATRKWSGERLLQCVENNKIPSRRKILVDFYLKPSIERFFDASKIGPELEDLRKKYLYYSTLNFKTLLDKYLDELTHEADQRLGAAAITLP